MFVAEMNNSITMIEHIDILYMYYGTHICTYNVYIIASLLVHDISDCFSVPIMTVFSSTATDCPRLARAEADHN